MDLSKDTNPELINKIDDQTKDIDISIVINNAGVISYDAFATQDPDFLNGMLNLNSIAPALVSQVFARRFIQRHKDKGLRSALVNVDSCAGSISIPYMANYCATKAFLRSFTLAISEELKE